MEKRKFVKTFESYSSKSENRVEKTNESITAIAAQVAAKYLTLALGGFAAGVAAPIVGGVMDYVKSQEKKGVKVKPEDIQAKAEELVDSSDMNDKDKAKAKTKLAAHVSDVRKLY